MTETIMKPILSKEHLGACYAILSGFLYGFVGYFGVSVVQSSVSVSNMLFWRFLISSLLIATLFLFKKNRVFSCRKSMVIAFCNGGIFYALSTMLYFFACPYIGSGLGMVIFFTYPALVMLLNHMIYGQSIPGIYYYAIVIIMIGMLLFVDTDEVHIDVIGIILAVMSALIYAGYIISSKQISALSPTVSTLMVCLGCMTTCLLISIANHSLIIPSTSAIWLHLVGISVLSTTVPILLFLYSLNYISSEKASILSVLEPIFVLIFGVTLLNEPMKLQYVIGVVIVLAGALLTLCSSQQRSLSSSELEQI